MKPAHHNHHKHSNPHGTEALRPAGLRPKARRQREGVRPSPDSPKPEKLENAERASTLRDYEAAMRLIQRQNYEKAAEIFEHLAQSGTPGVADRARVYLRFCGEKLRPRVRPLRSAEDYYVAGVSDLNSNRIDQGIEHLHRARKLDPRRGEIHYALAAGYSRRGDLGPAIAHLETSIQLDPQCRIQARHEEDFQALSRDPRFAALVSQARRTSAARA